MLKMKYHIHFQFFVVHRKALYLAPYYFSSILMIFQTAFIPLLVLKFMQMIQKLYYARSNSDVTRLSESLLH